MIYLNSSVGIIILFAFHLFLCKTLESGNESIKKVLTTFTGVAHRLQYVDNVNGRTFYNDSKSTNVKSTQIAKQQNHYLCQTHTI